MLRAAKRSRSIHAKQPPKREWILRLRAGWHDIPTSPPRQCIGEHSWPEAVGPRDRIFQPL